MKKIVLTGGGTLGHVMPNLYLIEDLNNYQISYIGSSGIEKETVKNRINNYYEIPAVKLIRGKIFKNFKIPFVLIKSIKKSKKFLKEIKPDVVFSKGGYVSLPVCIAAKMLHIPIVAHESDSSFGLANKIILKLCNTMCVNFKSLEDKNKKVVYTGPIFSKEYESKICKNQNLNLDINKKTILIVGGSLGSKIINEAVFEILDKLLKEFNIIHITGKDNLTIKSKQNYNAMEITKDIVSLYNIADFVIGRSGAGVTAECYFKHLPMLLIPLENGASRGDQLTNAEYYVKEGVAFILREADLTGEKLLASIKAFSNNLNMYKQAYQSKQIDNGKQKVLDIIEKSIK